VCEDSTLCDVRFQGQSSRQFQHLLISAKNPTRKFDELPFSHSRRPTILSNTPDLLATAAVSATRPTYRPRLLLILIAAFICIVVWVFGRKRKARFAKDARIPLDDGKD
jgi:cbb3-type cytochrome oxidase subunit 3